MYRILILNLPGLVLKSGSRWYNVTKKGMANIRYYPYPWFMGYATSLLKRHGLEVAFKDAIAMEWSVDETINFIRSFSPDFIVCEPTWISAEDDATFLNSLNRGIIKIAVGNYATNYPLECLKRTNVHYVVVGEYEFSLLEFFESHCRVLPRNFVSKTKQEFEMPELKTDLDVFPFPERDDTPIEFYNEPSCYGINVVMVSSRGCRLKCDYCNVEALYGRHIHRVRSAKNVVDEMQFLNSNYNFDEVYFDDDNMVSSKSHIDGICREIIKRELNVKWLCMGDGLVDDETLQLLARAGCTTYKYGLEHLDSDVLRAIPKPYEKERLLEIIKKCLEYGLRSYVNLIIGLPGTTKEKDLKMLKEVFQADPDQIQLSIATPYPGTTFYKKAKRNKWLISEDPRRFDATGTSAVCYPDYSATEIEEVFHLGWRLWYRHVFFKKPSTSSFFIKSEIKRHGLISTTRKGFGYIVKAIR